MSQHKENMTPLEVGDLLKSLLLKDLRIQCRSRNISPAGSREALMDRLKENMLDSKDFSIRLEGGGEAAPSKAHADAPAHGARSNNYARADGQNVGNFLTDRNSSRVLAPPGGGSQICFGNEPAPPPAARAQAAYGGVASIGHADVHGTSNNNYHRSGGQNVGNFITDRNSSRVLAPPGGASQITFG